MKKILFVCLGNICRSPMAEAVFRHIVANCNQSENFFIDSCGTGGWHQGEPPHTGTQEVLARNRISWNGQTARKITKDDLLTFDHIIVMDQQNFKDVILFAGKNRIDVQNISIFLEYLSESDRTRLKIGGNMDVPDPYHTGGFDLVFDLVLSAAKGLLSFCL